MTERFTVSWSRKEAAYIVTDTERDLILFRTQTPRNAEHVAWGFRDDLKLARLQSRNTARRLSAPTPPPEGRHAAGPHLQHKEARGG